MHMIKQPKQQQRSTKRTEHVTSLSLVLPSFLSPLSVIPFQALPLGGNSGQLLGDRYILRVSSSMALHALSESQVVLAEKYDKHVIW
jgi:hypothetical protein